jgi:hypothetical protein
MSAIYLCDFGAGPMSIRPRSPDRGYDRYDMIGGPVFWSCKKLCPAKVAELTYSKSRPKLRIVSGFRSPPPAGRQLLVASKSALFLPAGNSYYLGT